MARMEIGKEATEFGGRPGLYENEKQEVVDRVTRRSNVAGHAFEARGGTPAQRAATIRQTVPSDPNSEPELGDAGKRVAR